MTNDRRHEGLDDPLFHFLDYDYPLTRLTEKERESYKKALEYLKELAKSCHIAIQTHDEIQLYLEKEQAEKFEEKIKELEFYMETNIKRLGSDLKSVNLCYEISGPTWEEIIQSKRDATQEARNTT